jgi:hypothetical protein
MNRKQLDLIRHWLRAEIDYKIVLNEPDEDGYKGLGLYEKEEADRMYEEVAKALTGPQLE